MSDFIRLKGVKNIGDLTPSEIIADNMITFFDWGFLDIGAFFNVSLSTSGAYGGEKDNLRLVNDLNFVTGQVWEGFHRKFVWESGTTINEPIAISGVYVDSTFHPTAETGAFAHHYDYNNGRVVFETAISTTANVELEYSYKWIDVTAAKNIPFFKRLQYRANRLDSSHFNQFASGDWSNTGMTRIQLPSIAIEVPPIGNTIPVSLGTGWVFAEHDIKFHIMAEDGTTAVRLADILMKQTEKTIFLFNSNEIAASGAFPLDFRGMINSGAKSFPGLVDLNIDGGYRWRKLRFMDSSASNGQWIHNNLYLTTVTMETQTILLET